MVVAALAVDGIFSALGLIAASGRRSSSITERGITWNYTTVLNIVFTLVAAGSGRADACNAGRATRSAA